MQHLVKLNSILPITHDVKCFRFEKPESYSFLPGQATDVAINHPDWKEKLRPFTFTCLPDDTYLEFTIKRYPEHQDVTNHLHQLKEGDELLIDEPWGAIQYKGEGYFIAGGAGITPFIAIFRDLHRQNKLDGNTLYFSNQTKADIIYHDELTQMLSDRLIVTLTREESEGMEKGRISRTFLDKHRPDFHKQFYVCGPDEMVSDITRVLEQAGAHTDSIVFEK